MINTRRKIIKDKGGVPTPLEEEVAKALVEIEVSPSCDYKAEMREVYISGATEIEVGKGGEAMILHIPFRAWQYAKKIQSRLIKELEKKFNRKHVVLVASRTILDKDFRRKGLKDIVGPTEIVGKRRRLGCDGSQILKVLLDPRDKDKEHIDNKLPVYAAVYKKLTTKEAVFSFLQG
ncbi:40S ribosomal protein S7 [Durusdinium trenchii]|uniref:40S ribosomal protein S7 n=1 Tax=Durusdinium trenchii TaxID=1381693 RepID=A0ABP0H9X4_9DINO